MIWADVGKLAWLNTDSDQFYIDMALRSKDSRYDGKRPRIRVRAAPTWYLYACPFMATQSCMMTSLFVVSWAPGSYEALRGYKAVAGI